MKRQRRHSPSASVVKEKHERNEQGFEQDVRVHHEMNDLKSGEEQEQIDNTYIHNTQHPEKKIPAYLLQL